MQCVKTAVPFATLQLLLAGGYVVIFLWTLVTSEPWYKAGTYE